MENSRKTYDLIDLNYNFINQRWRLISFNQRQMTSFETPTFVLSTK